MGYDSDMGIFEDYEGMDSGVDTRSGSDQRATIDALVAALEGMQKFMEPMRWNRESDNFKADDLDRSALAALAMARK